MGKEASRHWSGVGDDTAYPMYWIRRIGVSFVVFGECRHEYAVSSLMDTAYRLSKHSLYNLPGFKYRHDMVRDVLYDPCRRVGISAKKEAPVNFLTGPLDERSTLRLADVLIFIWVGGKHVCVDLTGVSPLVGLSSWGLTLGHAALKAATCKVTKHEKACIEYQHVFIPFAFDTFGFLAPRAVKLLNII
nr:auxilin-like protein [Tanacetum cinerariifolium]